ncbi:testis-expressed protein 36 [Hippoglossus stenolepis]|uniref:testis-expressed protein 36 n=1 Tax=Hippoglossus stenolepis TaxID=195615 RepID=UPI001FAFDCD6|nr:testis-expressed protein 36 [Hippoglossus stenolepis]
MSIGGKWFAHTVLPESKGEERRDPRTCISTGIMLSQVESSLPQALSFERHPKWKSQQESREYPLSDHDNKHSLKDNIAVFTYGVGLRKCPDERKQQNSHFSLCPDGADSGTSETGGNVSAYETDFTVKPTAAFPAGYSRFTRNHKQKAAEAASARAGQHFLWFGRHDLEETPQKQSAISSSATSLFSLVQSEALDGVAKEIR